MTYFLMGVGAILAHWVIEALFVSMIWVGAVKPFLQWAGFIVVHA